MTAEKQEKRPFKHQVCPKYKVFSSSYTQPNCAGKNRCCHLHERGGHEVGGTAPVPSALGEGTSTSAIITTITAMLFPGPCYPHDQVWKLQWSSLGSEQYKRMLRVTFLLLMDFTKSSRNGCIQSLKHIYGICDASRTSKTEQSLTLKVLACRYCGEGVKGRKRRVFTVSLYSLHTGQLSWSSKHEGCRAN